MKNHMNTLVYDISYKTLHIRFDKLHGFIGVYHETIYLVIFGPEKYDAIYNRIRYLIGVKRPYNLC